MTVTRLTQSICNKCAPLGKRYDMRDTEVRGLFLRVEVTGRKTWYVNYRTPAPANRLKNKKLAPGEVTLADARTLARNFIARLHLEKVDPGEAEEAVEKGSSAVTLNALIGLYEPWVLAHRKSGGTTLKMLRLFKEFLDMPVDSITSRVVERWQMDNQGRIKGATINRRIAALKSMLNWAVRQGVLDSVPFKVSKMPQMDSNLVIRYLSPQELRRLMNALAQREKERGRDYLKTAVVLSLNTGIRRGTLMSLVWEDVNFNSRTLHLRAAIMKGGKSAVLPLNKTAFESLKSWRELTKRTSGYIFPGDGSKLKDTQKPFGRIMRDAGIENFTWHCLRHDFASQLAIRGVPLHIIQKLMCHASIDMTQRYAHLSPNSLENAVRLLEK